ALPGVELLVHVLDDGFHDLADALGFGARFAAEQRAAHDVEREAHHVDVDIAYLVVAERGELALRAVHHRLRIARDALGLQRRRSQLAITAPRVAFARDQAVADQRDQLARAQVLDAVLV